MTIHHPYKDRLAEVVRWAHRLICEAEMPAPFPEPESVEVVEEDASGVVLGWFSNGTTYFHEVYVLADALTGPGWKLKVARHQAGEGEAWAELALEDIETLL